MGRHGPAGGRAIIPIDTSGNPVTAGKAPGVYTLSSGTTYYYLFGGADAAFTSIHITGYTSGAILTSGTIQDCNHDVGKVTDFSGTIGEWVSEDPSTAFVGADGTGWTATNGVLAVAGTGLGGAMFHMAETGAARHRLAVVVGGTGGDFLVSGHNKE